MLLRLVEPEAAQSISRRKFSGRAWRQAARHTPRHSDGVSGSGSSLDPRMRVGAIVGEPLAIHESQALARRSPRPIDRNALRRRPRTRRAAPLTRTSSPAASAKSRNRARADPAARNRNRRRARLRPRRLRRRADPRAASPLQRELNLTYILISHSLPVVAQLATRVAVMRAGRFVEFGAADRSPDAPTRSLRPIAIRRHPRNSRVSLRTAGVPAGIRRSKAWPTTTVMRGPQSGTSGPYLTLCAADNFRPCRHQRSEDAGRDAGGTNRSPSCPALGQNFLLQTRLRYTPAL